MRKTFFMFPKKMASQCSYLDVSRACVFLQLADAAIPTDQAEVTAGGAGTRQKN